MAKHPYPSNDKEAAEAYEVLYARLKSQRPIVRRFWYRRMEEALYLADQRDKRRKKSDGY